MVAVDAYYNGVNIVLDKQVEMRKGQKMMVIYEPTEPKRKPVDLNQFGIWSERGQHVEEYMKEMRDNDRI